MYQLMVNGQLWIDSDGNDSWSLQDANALADHLESMGYTVDTY